MFKRIMVSVLAVSLSLAAAVSGYAAENTATVELDGRNIGMPAQISSGGIFLPLRAVCENMGYTVQWNGEERKVTAVRPGKTITLNIPGYRMEVNGHELLVTGAFSEINGSTYLREDILSENLGLRVAWDNNTRVTLESIKENNITINTEKESYDTPTLKITLQYPRIDGLADTAVQDKLNAQFKSLSQDAKNEGLKNEEILTAEEMEWLLKAETFFDYQVKYNQNGLISLVFWNYQYSGGAHGLTVQKSLTFDLKTGEELKLKDLFTDSAGYVQVLSREIKNQMQVKGMTELLNPFDAIRADQDFYIKDGTLVVYFQAYEYLPYAFGIPEFSVDLQQIKDLLNPGFAFLFS